MGDKYHKEFKCKNCAGLTWLSIPKGISVETHLNEHKTMCERCGVRLGKDLEDDPKKAEESEEAEGV